MTHDELLEMLAGVRCPCGHLVDVDHELVRSGRATVAGMVARCGPCRACSCRGLLECGDDEELDA